MEHAAIPKHETSNPLDREGLCLLSFDGGGVRGLSSLYVLKTIMDRLNHDKPAEGRRKPCEVFDLIGGTSTGGLIAIMLGRLEMDVEECIESYSELTEAVFGEKLHRYPADWRGNVQALFNSTKLENAVKAVISKRNMSDMELLNDEKARGCHVFVCAADCYTKRIVRLRSYKLPDHPNIPATICQAALATSAATTFFDEVSIDGRTFADGGFGANNPVNEVEGEASNIWCSQTAELKPLVKCFVSIGTGNPGVKPFENNIFEFLRKTLVEIATETENTETKFIDRWRRHYDEKRYFRFNVEQGLQGIGMDEYNKKGAIKSATEGYLTHRDRIFRVRDCVQNLALKQNWPGAEIERNITDHREIGITKRRIGTVQEFEFTDRHRSCLKDFHAYDYEDYLSGVPENQKATLSWIWKSSEYNEWQIPGSPKALAILGHPGCGKTVLAATLIRRLQSMASEADNNLVLYSFCYAQELLQNTAVSILRTLIHQLLTARPVMAFQKVLPMYNMHGNTVVGSFDTLWRLFVELCQGLTGTIFCILDALDECEDKSRQLLLRNFRDMYESNPTVSLKIVITSRPNFEILKCLFGWQSLLQIKSSDHFDQINKDIDTVIEAKVTHFCSSDVPEPLSTLIRETLKRKADGTFLWVDLVVRGLMNKNMVCSEEGITEYLAMIPGSLRDVYLTLLKDIYRERKEEARRLLRWVVCAAKPLTLVELKVALALRSTDHSMQDIRRRMYHNVEQELLKIAGPFLRIKGDEVHLVHHSAKDFLIEIERSKQGMGIQPSKVHLELSHLCLTYLTISGFHEASLKLHEQFNQKWLHGFEDSDAERLDGYLESYRETADNEQKREEHEYVNGVLKLLMQLRWSKRLLTDFPFLKYSGSYWPVHARDSGERTKYERFQWLVDDDSAIAQQWASIGSFHGGFLLDTIGQNGALYFNDFLDASPNLLVYAAYLGLRKLVNYFLENHTISPVSPRIPQLLQSALYASTFGQQIDILRSLLRRGTTELTLQKAVKYAAEYGREKATQEFLSRDLTERHVVLQCGSMFGHHKIVEMALNGPCLATWMDSSLLAACFGGHETVVKVLLDSNIALSEMKVSNQVAMAILRYAKRDEETAAVEAYIEDIDLTKRAFEVHQPNGTIWTPLMMASLQDNKAVVELLLAATDQSVLGRDCIDISHSLYLAAAFGNIEVFKHLLARRQVGVELSHSMLFACMRGRLDTIEVLLNLDIELLFQPSVGGGTPLHFSIRASQEEVVAQLVKKLSPGGRTIYEKDNSGESPLSLAAKEGNLGIFKILLDSRSHEFDGDESWWDRVIANAANEGHLEIFELILSKNALAKYFCDQSGRTALSYAAERGHLDILQLLMTEDIRIDADQDSFGRTPLSYACENGHLAIAQVLLQNTFELNHRADSIGRTPLSYASEEGHLELVELLIKDDTNTWRSSDEEGRTPLSYAAENGHLAVVELLARLSPERVDHLDHCGRSPSSYAAENDHSDIVKFLQSEHFATINSRDTEGRTALSYAAESGCVETVEPILTTHDPSWNDPDDTGKSPLYYAVTSGNEEVASFLVEHVRSAMVNITSVAMLQMAQLLLSDDELLVLCQAAISRLGVGKFEQNLRRLLRKYGEDLNREASNELHRQAAQFVHICAKRVATETVKLLSNSDNFGHWKSKLDTEVAALSENESGCTESDSNASDDMQASPLRTLDEVKSFMVSANAFAGLRQAFRAWLKRGKESEGKEAHERDVDTPPAGRDTSQMTGKSPSTAGSLPFSEHKRGCQQTNARSRLNSEIICPWSSLRQRWRDICFPVVAGYQRIYFSCGCGDLLYLDVKELSPGGVKRFHQIVLDNVAIARTEPNISNQNQLLPPPQAHLHPQVATLEPATAPLQHGTQQSQPQALQTGNTDQNVVTCVARDLHYLLLCVNTKHKTTLIQIEVSALTNDQYLFQRISEEYCKARKESEWRLSVIAPSWVHHSIQSIAGRLPALASLLARVNVIQLLRRAISEAHVHKIRSGDFVLFRLIPIGMQHCPQRFKPREIPPEVEVRAGRYLYEPVPMNDVELAHIPLGHLLKPGPHMGTYWLKTFPKKLHEQLVAGPSEAVDGWGIHVKEGLNWSVILLTLLVLLFTIGIGVTTYAKITSDNSSAFGLGSYLVALVTTYITYEYFSWLDET